VPETHKSTTDTKGTLINASQISSPESQWQKEQGFVHLHVHSNFSFKDAAVPIDKLVATAKQMGMEALALTDHNTLAGAIRFYRTACKAGIKAIIGVEIDLVDYGHLVLLAEDLEGYSNLCRLVTAMHLQNRYRQSICTWSDLERYAHHLIALTGCSGSSLVRAIHDRKPDEARGWLTRLKAVFGTDHLYVELQHHLLPHSHQLVDQLAELAKDAGLPIVATNNVHYLGQEDAQLRDLLVCLRENCEVQQPQVLRQPNDQYYLKSATMMAVIFSKYPQAINNSLKIAERCRLTLPLGQYHFPHYPLPAGTSAQAKLRELCEEALPLHYQGSSLTAAKKRLQHELATIIQMGFAEYFLVVWDLVHYAKEKGIRCSGRGSAGDSLVSYLLGITTVDPITHRLLFERFLNPERKGMPDIDIDFDSVRRDEILTYVYERYGKDHVAMIGTVNTFSARSSLREVAKAMGFGEREVDRIARHFPHLGADKINLALDRLPELRQTFPRVSREPLIQLFAIASALDDYPRHLSVHLGGMVIGREPLTDLVPLQWSTKGVIITQYDKDDIEALGLVKMDLLGLRILSAIEEAQKSVRSQGLDLDVDHLPLNDEQTYALLRSAKTVGVFQVESPGMRELLGRLQPDEFSHLVATLALFRPGPMQGDMIAPYIRHRHGAKVAYLHPDLEPILAETHGVIIYQEQVLQIASTLAGFTLGQADMFRRAMTHDRSTEEMETIRQQFLAGTDQRGIDRQAAETIFKQLAGFAAYGFNKAHAASFGWISYQTAYLSAHHPAEFFCAMLNHQPMGFYPARIILDEARRLGIRPLLPDINQSEVDCTVVSGQIRIGLRFIAQMTAAALQNLLEARKRFGPYRSLHDLSQRVQLPQPTLLNLIALGALDSLGDRDLLLRQAMLHSSSSLLLGDNQPLQLGLIDEEIGRKNTLEPAPQAPNLDRNPRSQVERELRLLGLAVTEHPLSFYRLALKQRGVILSSELARMPDGYLVRVAGLVVIRQTPPTRSKQRIIFFTLDDEDGLIDLTVFPRVQNQYAAVIMGSTALIVEGRLRKTGVNGISINVQRAFAAEEFLRHPFPDQPLVSGRYQWR
ncbi:MAG: DNA polymerase III subunit alpha, partial [Bacillota bacterium]